jgi:hypothetical protein
MSPVTHYKARCLNCGRRMLIRVVDDTSERWHKDCECGFRNLFEIALTERSEIGVLQRIESFQIEKNTNGLGLNSGGREKQFNSERTSFRRAG